MKLEPGVYETLISKALEERLSAYDINTFEIKRQAIDSTDAPLMLSSYLCEIVMSILKDCYSADESISAQVDKINSILKFIERDWNLSDYDFEEFTISEKAKNEFLRGIYQRTGYTHAQIDEKSKIHPQNGYRVSHLYTGGQNQQPVVDEIRRDIKTADAIDFIVSFIKYKGICLILDDLIAFVKSHRGPLRIITTTYMGATDPKALRALLSLKKYGDVQIKATFNTNMDRLHAKAYIFTRNSSFDTAYIGSSNISRPALTKGLEWNIRVTAKENPQILEQTKAAFETYWNSEDFKPIANENDLAEFADSIYKIRRGANRDNDPTYIVSFKRKDHQIKVLEKLQYEREVVGSRKNLIIAATGTGKTAISAFDYKDYNAKVLKEKKRDARLLFVVHREKILKQARQTFKNVMSDPNFGEIWTSNIKPSSQGGIDHLFISVQTLSRHWDEFSKMPPDYYDYIVIDEVHHGTAKSYREIFTRWNPDLLIGLTATPERSDNTEIKKDFNDRFAAEIRLTEALNQELLAPFDYFCVSDDDRIDLSHIDFKGGSYDVNMLEKAYIGNRQRFEIIQRALDKYITDPHACKAVCFCCSIKHAEDMAKMFNECQYKALSVTTNNKADLDLASLQLAQGKINYLCVADMLNEGIDIPEIDTVLFLRPTESLTVFLQQLGRGLRLADGKESLTVLDFVAQANKKYNYESRFRALVGKSKRRISEYVQYGFTMLPRGCSITLEKQAQEHILKNIKETIFNQKRLVEEAKRFKDNYDHELTLSNFLNALGIDFELIYKSPGSWSRLMYMAGYKVDGFDQHSKLTTALEHAFRRLRHINSIDYMSFINKLIVNNMRITPKSKREERFLHMFFFTVYKASIDKVNATLNTNFKTISDAVAHLVNYPWFTQELASLLEIRSNDLCKTTKWLEVDDETEIELYSAYTSDEVSIILEDKEYGGTIVLGTQYNESKKLAKVFVTLNKGEKEYSPTTRYEDYAISQHQFHWQSMNRVRSNSKEGQRIINQRENGWKYLLFVRDSKLDEFGLNNAYYCLGFMDFESCHGEAPMNVVWNMQSTIPGFLLETAKIV